MKKRIHALAGTLAMLCIAGFWLATLGSELFLDRSTAVAVKAAIVQAMWLLIPALMVTGGSGFALAGGHAGGLLGGKRRRMQAIAGLGLLVLLPAAVFLGDKAAAGEFDTPFFVVQALELAAGAVNFTLMAGNFRDGLRLAGRLA